jgi:hypothetical protein
MADAGNPHGLLESPVLQRQRMVESFKQSEAVLGETGLDMAHLHRIIYNDEAYRNLFVETIVCTWRMLTSIAFFSPVKWGELPENMRW